MICSWSECRTFQDRILVYYYKCAYVMSVGADDVGKYVSSRYLIFLLFHS